MLQIYIIYFKYERKLFMSSVVVFYKNFYFLYSENSENSDHKASAKATQNANQIEDKMKLRFSIVFITWNYLLILRKLKL